MNERTTQSNGTDNILVQQQTVTGGVRLYGTHVVQVRDMECIEGCEKEGFYSFALKTPFKCPSEVDGALTCTIAEWEADLTAPYIRLGCYVSRIEYHPFKVVVVVKLVHENVRIVSINVEGRIVLGKVPL